MSRTLLEDLAKHRGYPAISILMPTHRTHPANLEDSIQLKKLAAEIEARLVQEAPRREAKEVLDRLNEAVASIDFQHNQNGLAMFVTEDSTLVERLPFAVPARAQIDESFAIRDLVCAAERSHRYYALILSEKPTRLYECSLDHALERLDGRFPMEHGGPGGASRLGGGVGENPSAERDRARVRFIQDVVRELSKVHSKDPLPLVVAGTEDFLADFKEITGDDFEVLARIKGNYDSLSPFEIGKTVWPFAEKAMAEMNEHRLAALHEAAGSGFTTSGVVQVLQAAEEGRVRRLLAEESYHEAGIVRGEAIEVVADSQRPDAEDDLVDRAISATILKGGEVTIVPDGALASFDHVAAILRY